MAGYALTLLVGLVIVLLVLQLYADVRPLLTQQTDVFKNHAVTVSKNISLFKTANKEAIYFNDKELDSLESQQFVKSVARFTSAQFSVNAYINVPGGGRFSTDLFFESVPDRFLDVRPDAWLWDSASSFLPIIIPEEYLQLYNFGFAESQSMPVISQGMVEQISFNIVIRGNGQSRTFTSRIVGFSGKINTILVPDDFLQWANCRYGDAAAAPHDMPHPTPAAQRPSRLLVEFDDASDQRIPSYFENRGLNISQSELENSKMVFLFRLAMLGVFVIAVIIVVLSVAIIIMSMNLVVHKNRSLFLNLYAIGYSVPQIARYYQWLVSIITALDVVAAAIVAMLLRGLYVRRLSSMFATGGSGALLFVAAAVLCMALLVLCNCSVRRIVRKTVSQN